MLPYWERGYNHKGSRVAGLIPSLPSSLVPYTNHALSVFTSSQRYANASFHPQPLIVNVFIVGLATLFLLVTSPLGAHAVKLDQCGDRLRNAQDAAWNATHPSDPPPPLNLTYEQCLAECGKGLGSITWDVFPQSITAWFLPWIVLAFQIPFGAECEPFNSTRQLSCR